MGRIIGYQYDDNVQDGDAWIGSEDGGGKTKQYTAEAVANYLNIQGKISIVGQMTYEYVVGPQGGIGTFSLFEGGTSPVAFSSVAKLTYSNIDKGGQRVVEFLNLLVGSDVLIAKQNEISTFGYYTVDSYTVNASDSSYYDLAVTFKAGNGAMTFLEIYDVQNFVLANDATQSPWETVADGINYPVGNVGIGVTNSEDYFNIEKTDTVNSITRGSQVTLTKNNTTGTDFAASLYGFRSLVSNTSSGNVGYVQGSTDNARHSGTGDMYIMVGGGATSNHEGSGNASGVYGGFHSGKASGTGTTSINFLVGDVINATLNNPNATVQKYHGINNQLAFSAGTVTEEAAVALLDIDSNAAAIINGDFSYLYIKQNSAYPTISGDARSIYSNSILPSTFTGSVSIGKSALPTSALEVLGNVKFDSYGSGAITGTPTQRLGVDASGNVIEIPIGSGAVDGAGTTNFVTKWLDTDTVGDSVIFDNGTNVGIGTTSPGYNLVVGDGTTDTESRFYHSDASYTSVRGYGLFMSRGNSYIRPVNDGSQTLYIGTNSKTWGTFSADANIFTLNRDGASRLYINSSGNVGIGTTSPSSILDINGGSANGVNIQAANTGTEYVFNAKTSNGTSRLWVGGAGNVGIGTTTPLKKLEVRSSSAYNSTIRLATSAHNWDIQGGEAGYSSIAFALDYDGVTFFRAMGTTDARFGGGLSVGTLNATPPTGGLYVAGNVGIGTTSPGTKLDVSGQIRSNDSFLLQSGTTAIGSIRNQGGALDIRGDSARDVSLGSVTSPQALFIEGTNGNVGIGTTSPASKLHIGGGVGALSTGLTFGDGDTGIWEASDDNLRFSTSSSTRMIINSSGNVGIGTTSPSRLLDVDGVQGWSAGNVEKAYMNPTSTGTDFNLFGNNGNIRFDSRAGSNSYINTGNVGIGTTSPTSKLEVAGGDIELSDVAGGITMISPDGTRYRITVANGGTLTVTAV
tara:strand:+ start:133 stop:3033 length:2901 start_codon:yes stop_codon:yes gene_type:complete